MRYICQNALAECHIFQKSTREYNTLVDPCTQKENLTYLCTTLTPVPHPASSSTSTQACPMVSRSRRSCHPTITSSTPNACPVPDTYRTCMIPGCTTDRVYDEPWRKEAHHRRRWVKVVMGEGTMAFVRGTWVIGQRSLLSFSTLSISFLSSSAFLSFPR